MGDRIHRLEKGFANFEEGTIFIRRRGETARANSVELDMLVERQERKKEELGVGLILRGRSWALGYAPARGRPSR